jgi:hypothetical protein
MEFQTISVPPHTMKEYGGRDIVPLILYLGTGRE